jgi:hypothetical protein
MIELIVDDGKPVWLQSVSEYKDLIEIVIMSLGLGTLVLAARQLRDTLNQRAFNETIALHQAIEPDIRAYQEIEGNNEEELVTFWLHAMRVINTLEIAIEHVNKKYVSKTQSHTISHVAVMAIHELSTFHAFSSYSDKLVNDRFFSELRIFFLRNYNNIDASKRGEIYRIFFGEESGELGRDDQRGRTARKRKLRQLIQPRKLG